MKTYADQLQAYEEQLARANRAVAERDRYREMLERVIDALENELLVGGRVPILPEEVRDALRDEVLDG